ncbi:hypothetical protein RUR49_14750 [Pseudoxanthobacter sp. M-2]|uniref:hypothetical protein n=1 Tax=Pseudoxanthobacter sp. M-2 TaxID=3078754 RepID=UPI0038FC5842
MSADIDPPPRIRSVKILDELFGKHRLLVRWSDGPRKGESDEVDLSQVVFNRSRFTELRDNQFLFAIARVADFGENIIWRDIAKGINIKLPAQHVYYEWLDQNEARSYSEDEEFSSAWKELSRGPILWAESESEEFIIDLIETRLRSLFVAYDCPMTLEGWRTLAVRLISEGSLGRELPLKITTPINKQGAPSKSYNHLHLLKYMSKIKDANSRMTNEEIARELKRRMESDGRRDVPSVKTLQNLLSKYGFSRSSPLPPEFVWRNRVEDAVHKASQRLTADPKNSSL